MTKHKSLIEFAAQRRTTRPCWVCDLPELPEMHEAKRQGVSTPAIIAWLKQECGYADVKESQVTSHFHKRHGDLAQ